MAIIPSELMAADLTAPSEHLGPRNFHWLVRGRLGGTSRPGLAREIEIDLAALRRVGATVLYTLTEEWRPPVAEIGAAGLKSVHVPITDMAPPTPQVAAKACAEIERYLQQGEVVVHHCHAGRGRTGTLLACQLIWHGATAEEAFRSVRMANRHWIESAEQEAFLEAFERHCALDTTRA